MNSEIEQSPNQIQPGKKDQSQKNGSDYKTDKKDAPDEVHETHYESDIVDPIGDDSEKEVEYDYENKN